MGGTIFELQPVGHAAENINNLNYDWCNFNFDILDGFRFGLWWRLTNR